MPYVPNYFGPHRVRQPGALEYAERPETPLMLPLPMVYERIKQERARWEYTVVSIDPRDEAPLTEARLSELGAEGWLLTSVQELAVSQSSRRVFYYFVRQAEEQA
ncbi:MAG TPA: hypothetical protein VKQ36_00395 [Ktedonobacterales bacterium]|nr:hypothetical protein [Ktedonobacterales bacterium]